MNGLLGLLQNLSEMSWVLSFVSLCIWVCVCVCEIIFKGKYETLLLVLVN